MNQNDMKEKQKNNADISSPYVHDKKKMEAVYHDRAIKLATRKSFISESCVRSQIIIFSLDTERYALELDFLSEVILFSSITPVPKAPQFIDGIINFRGEINCVLNLKKIIGLGNVENHRPGYILMLKKHGIGLSVDNVIKIGQITSDEQTDNINKRDEIQAQFGKRILEHDIILLNVDRITTYLDIIIPTKKN